MRDAPSPESAAGFAVAVVDLAGVSAANIGNAIMAKKKSCSRRKGILQVLGRMWNEKVTGLSLPESGLASGVDCDYLSIPGHELLKAALPD